MAEKIRRVTVEYEDGRTEEWTGRGSANVVRSGKAAKTAPVLADDDISYVSAVLVFNRDEPIALIGTGPAEAEEG